MYPAHLLVLEYSNPLGMGMSFSVVGIVALYRQLEVSIFANINLLYMTMYLFNTGKPIQAKEFLAWQSEY